MTGERTQREASDDLVRRGARRLEEVWQSPVAVGEVLVAMPDRSVFRTVAPDGSAVVVKADTWPGRATAERGVTAAASAAALPVPAIIHASAGDPALLVLQYVPGPALGQDAPGAAWIDAGRILRRLHDLRDPGGLPAGADGAPDRAAVEDGRDHPTGGARTPLREILPASSARQTALAAEHGLLSGRAAARLRLLLGEIFGDIAEPERYCVLHGDPQPDHFLLTATAGIAALIDFGDACTGDPAWDLAVLTLDDPGRLSDVLSGYAPDAAARDRSRAMIGPYRLLRWLGEANWLHEHGFDPGQPLAALRHAAATGSREAALPPGPRQAGQQTPQIPAAGTPHARCPDHQAHW